MGRCCSNCFIDIGIQDYISSHSNENGDCEYCNSSNVELIDVDELGEYIVKCLKKGYEDIDEGTGASYDGENKAYLGPDGEEATRYSVRDILLYEEVIFSDNTNIEKLIEAIYGNVCSEDDFDSFAQLDSSWLVVRDDLYGVEAIDAKYSWERFKHIVKHYNRFFDMGTDSVRWRYLNKIAPYFEKYKIDLKAGMTFCRCRIDDKKELFVSDLDAYKELSPAPTKYAQTNRMSPAGISYLYLASDISTAIAETRAVNKSVLNAVYTLNENISIIDFTKDVEFVCKSIFSDEYNHEERWIPVFFKMFTDEISKPVDDKIGDHSYEYVATQVIAEYIRSLGYDGICFNSSVGKGKNYVFFVGPDVTHTPDAYPYPFGDPYIGDDLPILKEFTKIFSIEKVQRIQVNDNYDIDIEEERLL